jgi:hypothetical protein
VKVAVICEFSGIVRTAFSKLGHEAISFDLLPSELPGDHMQIDVLDLPYDYWQQFDLSICHPPCTYLTYAGNHVWNYPGRDKKRNEAMQFFMYLVNLPIQRICIENPVGMPGKLYRPPDQIIHPYYFGDTFHKRTCLWLKNLPLLNYKMNYKKPEPVYFRDGKPINFCEAACNKDGLKRWQVRSITSQKIAEAMAEQWTNIKNEQLCLCL